MSIIDKQLAINRIQLPTGIKLPMDVINIIKDFVFYDEKTKTKNKKNSLIARMQSLHYTSFEWGEHQLHYTGFIFDGRYPNENAVFVEDNNPQIWCDFCLKCGNYQNNVLIPRNNKTICHCVRVLPQPYFWRDAWRDYWKS